MAEDAGRKKSLTPVDQQPGPTDGETEKQIDWEETVSTPLKPKGGKKPKLVSPSDKHATSEGTNGFITFSVEGDPAPEVEWFKGFKDLSVESRYKFWTCGEDNTITLGCFEARSEDEGDYKVVVKNEHGSTEFDFKFYVTVEGGMDFRAMLMKRKVKQKKVVVKKIEWIESPVDQEVQQGKCEEVIIKARLSEKEKKGKWYIRNATTFKDIRSSEYGLELFKGEKYDWSFKEDTYTLVIRNPTPVEEGTYQIVVKELDMKASGYLAVKAADPEYCFKKFLKDQEKGLTARSLKLTCHLNTPGARTRWLKNGSPMTFDNRIERQDKGEKLSLVFRTCEMDDTGTYSCEIMEFVKNGEKDQTDCWLQVEEYPHTFTSKLKGQTAVEHDRVEFEIDVEATDAEVTWFRNGKKITPDQDGRIEIVVEGKKRKLVIKDAHLEDAGEITCATNRDSSSCSFQVKYANEFTKGLDQFIDVVEREEYVFNVEVKDPGAPVEFYMKGEKVSRSDPRCEYVNLGEGKHQLIIHSIKMEDLGLVECRTPSNRGDQVLVSSATFDVTKGEDAPEIGTTGPVTGIAYKDCNWQVPYKIVGHLQSKLEVIVMKDGKELKLGQDVNVNIKGDSIDLAVINPRREKSGVYKVILKNAQGQDERDIMVNIMDKPLPPQFCKVSDVYHDNCKVAWKEPVDDGGTEITRYIIEALDRTLGNDWHQVSEPGPGDRQVYQIYTWSQVSEPGPGDRQKRIDNLANRHKYRFRVIAINKIGRSQPCEMLGDDIMIKDPWDEPTQPGRPNILDWGPEHCDLSWEPPESDGGAPITHYVIEMKEKSLDMWQVGRILTAEECEMKRGLVHGTCPGLVEGNEYMFRIKAVNIGSKNQWNYSIPSEPSDSMIAKIRYIKAFIHDPGMYDIEIKKGQTFRYDIWFGGEPPPSVTWERHDGVINPENDDRITMELFAKRSVYCQKNTVLTVKKADRKKDCGRYKIRLTCEGGNFEATGFVNVLDVPSRPRAFQPDEVRAEHVKLSWEAPEDDGGTPVLRYLVKIMDLDYNQWLNACEVNAATTQCTVKNLKPGHLYRFEVSAINKEGESLPTQTKDPVTAENPYKPPSEPREPGIVDFDNKSVTLRWNKPVDDGGRPITHFVIQKKDQFGGWFDALITNDDHCCATIDELEARVPGLSEGKWYQFRIVAVNKAGESWPSFETKPHLCRHKNLAPTIDKGAGGSKSVKVNRLTCWRINVKGEPPPTFLWKKEGKEITSDEKYQVETIEYQGGSTAVLQILKTQLTDAGTYSLQAFNRNGTDKVELDLIVLESQHDNDCDMFRTGSLECNCTSSFRTSELSPQLQIAVNFAK
ncbi:twitchin isoform X2 [Eurytemora carolleeae]|uniref:twitchin isoform X2 n=1 Tax=Eurytemora carolleeae TaxID=1294199 RepID=UPI000C77F867|nr:twitchin isoform X2 [Eurytemora carolleeae]|eukprot:XP_023324296.1 twitchin-like isoform X2 [Eurytemora affinis]